MGAKTYVYHGHLVPGSPYEGFYFFKMSKVPAIS